MTAGNGFNPSMDETWLIEGRGTTMVHMVDGCCLHLPKVLTE